MAIPQGQRRAGYAVALALLLAAPAYAADLELGPSVSHRDGGRQTDVTTMRNTTGETRSLSVLHNGVPTTAQVPPGASVTIVTTPGSQTRPMIVVDPGR